MLLARIGSFGGRHLFPHLTLFVADVSGELEPLILRLMGEGLRGCSRFTLRYQGITHFPNKRVIHVDPVEKAAIAALRLPLVSRLRQPDALGAAVREAAHPHLTVAAGLKPHKFAAAWELLRGQEVSGQGTVAEVVLLRRALKAGARYKELRRYPLD